MKKKLFRYYSQNRKHLITLTIISTTVFAYLLTSFLLQKKIGENPSVIIFKESYSDHTLNDFIFWEIFRIMMNILFNIYVIYDINNVSFKKYISAILYGYRIRDPLHNASIFIVKGFPKKEKVASIDTLVMSKTNTRTDTLLPSENSINSSYQLSFDRYNECSKPLAENNGHICVKYGSSNLTRLINSNNLTQISGL